MECETAPGYLLMIFKMTVSAPLYTMHLFDIVSVAMAASVEYYNAVFGW